MAQQAELTHVGEGQSEKPFWQQYKVFYAAFAQFCYCGAQGTCPPFLAGSNK
jgi:FHS family L-fucose permease-like MFS transporter